MLHTTVMLAGIKTLIIPKISHLILNPFPTTPPPKKIKKKNQTTPI